MRHVWLLICAAIGCVDEGDLELAEGQSELVGGVPTTARPEIGRFERGDGTACTATLIGPSLVITAASCLQPAYTATTPPFNSKFAFVDATGVRRTRIIDAVHSFATQRWERPFPGSWFTTDVAILHLFASVPSWQAVPAELAVQEPVHGQAASMYGSGCTSRDPMTGGGPKQVVSFTYGNNTRALCGIDFGGPVVYGTDGPVWGINSDWDGNFPNWTMNSWTDMWGNVPFYKKQIEAVSRSWEGGLEVGWDRYGLDYMNGVVDSVATCKANCEADANCRAFTFRVSDNMCWRKNGISEPIPAPFNITGLPSSKQSGIDRPGGDYAMFSVPSVDTCAASCARDERCQAYNHNGTTCWLKSSITPAVACSTCTSGVTRRGQELNYDRPGDTFSTVAAPTQFQCANKCAQNSTCESYSFANGVCSLKNGVPQAIASSVAGSGVRRGLEINSDRPGMTFSTFTTQELTPNACQAACANNAACQAWSYLPPTASNGNATCELKVGVPAQVFSTGRVSGIKGLEMMP